jgi:hypothetical protein
MSKLVRVLGLSLLLAALTATAVAAQEGVPLAFKFNRGDVLDYDVSLSGAGALRGPDGETAAVGVQGSMRLSFTVVDVQPDGTARLGVKMPNANMQMTIGKDQGRMSFENGRLRWFANGKEQAPPDRDLSQVPLLGVPLEFVAAPNGKIIDVTMPNLQGMPGLPQLPPGLQTPQLQNLGDPIFPDAPVKVGETWRRSTQVSPFGPSMPITITSSRTLDSYSNTGGMALAKISGFSEARFRMNPMTVSPGEQSVTVGVPDMRKTVTSTEFFNPSEGKLVRADYDVSFNMRVSVGTGAQTQPGSLEARFRTSVQAR